MLKVELDKETEAYLVDILAKEKTTSDELVKRIIYQYWLSLQLPNPIPEKRGEHPAHLLQDASLASSQQENQQGAIALFKKNQQSETQQSDIYF